MTKPRTQGKKQATTPTGKGEDGKYVKKEREIEAYAQWIVLSVDELKELYNGDETDPKKMKVVKGTDGEFGRMFNVRRETLSKWKHGDDLWRRREKYLKEMRRYTASCIRGLIRNCQKNGSGTDVKALMEIIEGRKFGLGSGIGSIMDGLAGAADEGVSGQVTVNADGSAELKLRLAKYADRKPDAKA